MKFFFLHKNLLATQISFYFSKSTFVILIDSFDCNKLY